EGKMDRAQEVLQVLNRYAADDPQGGGTAAILQNLVGMMRDQVSEAKRKNDKALLEKTTAGFTAFLDGVRKEQKNLSPETVRLLAQSYASLDKHAQALELLATVEEPKGKGGMEPDKRLVDNYHACQLLRVRELRLNGQLEDAQKALDEL